MAILVLCKYIFFFFFFFSNSSFLHSKISFGNFGIGEEKAGYYILINFENSRHFEFPYFRRFKLGARKRALVLASMATLDTCPETRRWNRTAASETHIKAVDKRKGALIVRRSIHEVAGYGYTYVLRCAYTPTRVYTSPHTRCDYSRVHVWCTCVITNTVESESCHAWSRHIYVLQHDGMVSGSGE